MYTFGKDPSLSPLDLYSGVVPQAGTYVLPFGTTSLRVPSVSSHLPPFMSRKVVEDHSLEFFCLFRCANTKISYVVALSSDRVSLRSYSVPGLVTPDLHLVWSHLYFLTVTLDSGESPGKFTTVKGGSSLPTVKTLGLSYPRGV